MDTSNHTPFGVIGGILGGLSQHFLSVQPNNNFIITAECALIGAVVGLVVKELWLLGKKLFIEFINKK